MQTITDTINGLHLGEAASFEGLTVFPLFGDHVQEKDYLTLDEALEQEQARVIEVSEAGDVPNLLFETLGDRFADTIRGILGSTVQRLPPAERRQKLAALEERWTALNKDYLDLKSKIEEPERSEVEELISKAKELILKGKVEAAELKLLNLDFKIKDFNPSTS